MRLVFAFAFVLIATASHAHVVITDPEAIPGVTHAALFQVGHGCGESPTVALRIEIPDGVKALSAVPEEGWTMRIAQQGGRIGSVTWSGGYLPPTMRAGFGILLQLPEKPATFYFPAVQTCKKGENRWTEIPVAGSAARKLNFPAPSLSVVPKRANAPENPAVAPAQDEPSHHHH
jgi:uncharacterized protein YcnI